jgi:hypothetical protein
MKQIILYLRSAILAATLTFLAWSFLAPEGKVDSHNTMTAKNMLQEGNPEIEVCREALSVEHILAKDFQEHETCEPLALHYKRIIDIRARDYSLEPSLVSALITIESNWNPQAISRSGAIGLMQLMPATAREMGVHDPFNPTENIEGGMRYLSYLMEKFDGNVTLAVAAYNAGPRRIQKYRDIPPIRETQRYVRRVLNLYNRDRSSDSI